MKSFEEIYRIVEESSHETAFTRGECTTLYELLQQLKKGSRIVEIGVQFGRSMTVFAEMQKEFNFEVIGVDNWQEDESKRAQEHILSQMKKYNWNIELIKGDSMLVSKDFHKVIDLLHIDGDHTFHGVLSDCFSWIPKVASGGYICFDDFEHASLPEVTKAVEKYIETTNIGLLYQGLYDKLGVFRKL